MIELLDPEKLLLQLIADKRTTRADVATAYRAALSSSGNVDWQSVSHAIIARWSHGTLDWITERAWR